MKDGTMQIIAYAEDRTTDCVRRGVIYNIEKTTQSLRNVINKLESALKFKITKVYVGLGGQSVRSFCNEVTADLVTPTCINQRHIDSMTENSHSIPPELEECELIGSYPLEYVVDSSYATDPVGVVGTNIGGIYLNIIANKRLRNNIGVCLANIDIMPLDYRISIVETANRLLTDTEKRSGSALIDFGAGTTTLIIYKGNVVRHVTTIPLGFRSIINDICSLEIEESDAEKLLYKYGSGVNEESPFTPTSSSFTTQDGRDIPVSLIQRIITARLKEILDNINEQINASNYASKLLGGLILTGGGTNLKKIENAVMRSVKIDKVRIATTMNTNITKVNTINNFQLGSNTNFTIASLLLSGKENCVGEPLKDPDIFNASPAESSKSEQPVAQVISVAPQIMAQAQQQPQEPTPAGNATPAAATPQPAAPQPAPVEKTEQDLDNEAIQQLEIIKGHLRDTIVHIVQLEKDCAEGVTKSTREEAEEVLANAHEIINNDYDQCTKQLMKNVKYKQTLREAEELIAKRDSVMESLEDTLKRSKNKGGIKDKLNKWLNELMKD